MITMDIIADIQNNIFVILLEFFLSIMLNAQYNKPAVIKTNKGLNLVIFAK